MALDDSQSQLVAPAQALYLLAVARSQPACALHIP